MNLTVPRVGELAVMEGAPDGVTCWAATIGDVVVAVLIEAPSTLEDLDVAFVADAVENREKFLGVARAEVARVFGDEVAESAAGPELTFHAGQEWVIRFAECSDPSMSELGVLVIFDGQDVTDVEDLSDVDE